jgi:hypothetical protein
MDTIRTTSVVRDGRVTVKVPNEDGVRVDVIIRPAPPQENIDEVLAELRDIRADRSAYIASPQELKRAIEQGRP